MTAKSNNISSVTLMAMPAAVLDSRSFVFLLGTYFYSRCQQTVWYEFVVSRYRSVDSYLLYVFANITTVAILACEGSGEVVQLSTLGHQCPLHEETGRLFYRRGRYLKTATVV
jgi:hypothetical protein